MAASVTGMLLSLLLTATPHNVSISTSSDSQTSIQLHRRGHCRLPGVNVSALPGRALEGRSTGAHFQVDSAEACLLACCGNSTCNAFTFNSWQPGPRPQTDACPTGTPCCWLKDAEAAALTQQSMVNATSAIVRPGPPAPARGPLPTPTPQQLAWAKGGKYGISALIHWNMATFATNAISASTPARTCMKQTWADLSDPTVFAPSDYDPTDWASAMKVLGIEEAVLTAKHGCGFTLWPTNTTLPNGTRYPYRAEIDYLTPFVAAMRQAGIGHGFYYNFGDNYYLNKRSCTGYVDHCDEYCGPSAREWMGATCSKLLPGQENISYSEYEKLIVAQVSELWSIYGNFTEIWFDGGVMPNIKSQLLALLRQKQPYALLFNFPKQGGYLSARDPERNSGRWFGGNAVYNYSGAVWSTFCCDNPQGCISQTSKCALNLGGGELHGWQGCVPDDVRCNTFLPAAHEDVIQEGGHWFFVSTVKPRPVFDMIQIYHKTVARNVLLELDFAIDTRGKLAPAHREFYAQFGQYLEGCYGSAVATGELSFDAASAQIHAANSSSTAFVLEIVVNETIDRVIIEENQTKGQRILAYSIVAMRTTKAGARLAAARGDEEQAVLKEAQSVVFGSGTSVGSKSIAFGSDGFLVWQRQIAQQQWQMWTEKGRGAMWLRLEVTATARNMVPSVARFAAFKSCACPEGSPPDGKC